MSAVLWMALLLQVIAIALLRMGLGKQWLQRPVTLLLLTSSVYIGLSPVLLSFGSIRAWDTYRHGIRQSYVDEATLIMAAGMLAFTVAYLLTRPELLTAPPSDLHNTVRKLDWRLLSVACLPLAVLTYRGRGYGNGTLTTGAGAPLSAELASEFFVILVALAAFAFVLRHGHRWFLPVLIAQSVLLAAAGERTPVITDAIVLGVLLSWSGLRPSAAQLRAAAALTLIAVLAITGVRAHQGRAVYHADSGLSARVTALGGGITDLGAQVPEDQPGLLAQAAVRLDGTDFAGAILQSEHLGSPHLGASYVPESLLLAVPSAAWPSKLTRGLALDPVLLQTDALGLPVNMLPGLAGLYAGFLSVPWLITLLAGLGMLAGRGERSLLRRRTPARLVLLAGAVTSALSYEQGLPGMLVIFRAAVVLALAVKLAGAARMGRLLKARQDVHA